MAMSENWIEDYQRFRTQAAWRSPLRTQIELRGADRQAFLNNYCTADVGRLEVGHGTEAFLTSVQGKTLAYLLVFCCPESLVLDTEAGQTEPITAHLDRYILREDVQLHDQSQAWHQCWVAGPEVPERLPLEEGAWPAQDWTHGPAGIAGLSIWVRRLAILDVPLFALVCESRHGEQLQRACQAALGDPASPAAFHALRVENGFPQYGPDINDKNLPQEVGRNRQAISFTKGCYLGQETVARIDALGHVNRKLVGLRFMACEPPPVGTELVRGSKIVGQVTSATFSPRAASALALAYVRRECNAPGTRLESNAGAAEIVTLPWGSDQ